MRMRKEVFILNIDDILPNRFQPRIKFDEKAILELSESIKKHGVIQPIIVRKIADKYEIIAGERRYKASVIAGRKTIPAIVTDVDDKESAEIALIENVQRQDMTPIEEAISYKKILDMGYLNQTELALKLGKTQSTIANKLRLLNLIDEVQEALLEEKISERHARSLLKLDKNDQKEMLNKIITERLTVRKTDQLINEKINIKEEKRGNDNMNNNFNDINNNFNDINNDFNIPTNPIVNEQPINNEFMNSTQPNSVDINNMTFDNDINNTPQQPFNPFGMPEQPVVDNNLNPFNIPAVEPQLINNEVNPVDMSLQDNVNSINNQESSTDKQSFNFFNNPIVENPKPQVELTPNPFGMPEQSVVDTNSNPSNISTIEPQPINNEFMNSTQPNLVGINNMTFNNDINNTPQQPFNPFGMPEPTTLNPINEFSQDNQNNFEPQSSFSMMPNYPLPEEKELTPLMPEDNISQERVDMKTVIDKVRDCIKQIEAFGYKVDSDELDFDNTYEINIKIEKN